MNLLWTSVVFGGDASAAGQWDLVSMWHNMDIPAKVVVVILFVMSAWSVGIMIDRALMYSAARKQSRVFVQHASRARLKDNKLGEAISIAERNKKSHIAKVVATGLSEFQAASSQVNDAEVIEAAKRGLERSIATVHAEMKRGLSGLATIEVLLPSSDCSAPSWASSARSRASQTLRQLDCPLSQAVFGKPWSTPRPAFLSTSRLCGRSTTERTEPKPL